jgi:hypothetical protein
MKMVRWIIAFVIERKPREGESAITGRIFMGHTERERERERERKRVGESGRERERVEEREREWKREREREAEAEAECTAKGKFSLCELLRGRETDSQIKVLIYILSNSSLIRGARNCEDGYNMWLHEARTL